MPRYPDETQRRSGRGTTGAGIGGERMGRREEAPGVAADRGLDYIAAPTWARPTEPEGPYAGVGPKGYRRSDERIEEEVNERLTAHAWLDATDIEVRVEQGIVRLTGTVPYRISKWIAEEIAAGVAGVDDVYNDLRLGELREGGRR